MKRHIGDTIETVLVIVWTAACLTAGLALVVWAVWALVGARDVGVTLAVAVLAYCVWWIAYKQEGN